MSRMKNIWWENKGLVWVKKTFQKVIATSRINDVKRNKEAHEKNKNKNRIPTDRESNKEKLTDNILLYQRRVRALLLIDGWSKSQWK